MVAGTADLPGDSFSAGEVPNGDESLASLEKLEDGQAENGQSSGKDKR